MTDKTTGEMGQVDPGMSVVPEAGLEDVPTIIPELDSALAAVPSKLPAYVTTTWKNKPSTATPVTAEVMTRVEQRLVDLTNAVNALQDSVSQKVTCYADSAYLSQDANREVLVQICCKGSGSYLINFTKTGITLYD